ncbi:acrB/AcrD/AcrF family protein, partial [Vibrio harveyi]
VYLYVGNGRVKHQCGVG